MDKDFPCFDKNGNMTEMRFHYKMKVIFFIPYIISKLNNDFPTIFNAICHETYRKKKVYLQHD